MRVITLLPAATEIVAALGGGGSLVGISHECDYPASIRKLPRVTATPVDIAAPGAAIDAEVRRLHDAGQPVIGIDAEQVSRLAPDLIITQALCDVCAVADGQVHRLSAVMGSAPRILSLGARSLSGIWDDIRRVGNVLDLEDDADELVVALQNRMDRIRQGRRTHARVLCIEWLEPLYLAGHWVPDLVDAAGGDDVGARPGSHSTRRNWAELGSLRPDLIIVALCGFGVERARAELEAVTDPAALGLFRQVPAWIIDGNAYTSRPGPRVVDAAQRIQWALGGRTSHDVHRWQPRPH